MKNIEATILIFNKNGSTETITSPLEDAKSVLCTMLGKHTEEVVNAESLLLEGESIETFISEFVDAADNNYGMSNAVLFKDINIKLDNDKSTLCLETNLI